MKEDIVQKFLKSGKLLTPEALDELLKGRALADAEGLVVTKNDVAAERRAQDSVRVLKNITEIKKEYTVNDVVRAYSARYEKIKNILTVRLQKNFVSLNKLDNYRDEVYAIGAVRSVREKDGKVVVELEDPTATVPIIFEKDDAEDLDTEDVVAIRAVSAKNVMFGKQIVFPDVPLRQPKTGFGRICFAPSLNLDEAPMQDAEKLFAWIEKLEARLVFFAGDVGDARLFEELVKKHCYGKSIFVIPGEKDSGGYPQPAIKFSYDKITSLSNPAMLEVNGLNVLLTHNFGLGALKKRYLGTKKTADVDQLVIEYVPDLVLFNHHADTQTTNYKSITIANAGSLLSGTNALVIDLATREVEHVAV